MSFSRILEGGRGCLSGLCRYCGAYGLRLFVAIQVFVALVVSPATYANDDVFVVARVPVMGQADSAIAAKQRAEVEGRRQAMDILLRRLAPASEWDYLPQLASGQAANVSTDYTGKQSIILDDQQLLDLEQSFEVFDEKSSPTSYRAFITYRFKPAETRNLLIRAQIPYSEAQTRIALVLPVLETDRGLYLWEQNNPWLKAWQTRPMVHELTPMTAPLGDLEDSTNLTPREALALDTDKLAMLANRYGVSQVIIAHGRLSQDNGQDSLRVRLINGFRESGALDADPGAFSSQEALNDLARQTERQLSENGSDFLTPGTQAGGLDAMIAGRPGDVLAEVWVKQGSGNFPGLADRSIVRAVSEYASDWKSQTLIDHSLATVLRASAFFGSLDEWRKIRTALISTPLVGSVQVRNLSREGAEMSIEVYGDPGKLVVAMESQGLSLWTFDQGPVDLAAWNIATPATAAIIPVDIQRAPFQLRKSRRVQKISDFTNGLDQGVMPGVNEAGFSSPGTDEWRDAPDGPADNSVWQLQPATPPSGDGANISGSPYN